MTEMIPSLPHMAGLSSIEASVEEVATPTGADEHEKTLDFAEQQSESARQARRTGSGKPRLALSSLLRQADELYRKFPPDHPELKLSTIMGPQSVVFTWKESVEGERFASGDARDDEAEAMILHPELIVYPDVPELPATGDKESEDESRVDVNHGEKRRRRKSLKPRLLDTRTKTMVAGAIVVLGVAMAVYGIRQRGSTSGMLPPPMQKRWTQGKQWIGSALAGATVKYVQDLTGLGGENDGHGEL